MEIHMNDPKAHFRSSRPAPEDIAELQRNAFQGIQSDLQPSPEDIAKLSRDAHRIPEFQGPAEFNAERYRKGPAKDEYRATLRDYAQQQGSGREDIANLQQDGPQAIQSDLQSPSTPLAPRWRWRALLAYLVDRLDERSTWVWIVSMVGTIAGVAVDPARASAIAAVGATAGTLLGILLADGPVRPGK
jgi:hypothetical protein